MSDTGHKNIIVENSTSFRSVHFPSEQEVDVLDPTLLIADHEKGDGTVTDQMLEQFVKSGLIQYPTDKKKLEDYLNSLKANPFR
jgi:hypothetical protein